MVVLAGALYCQGLRLTHTGNLPEYSPLLLVATSLAPFMLNMRNMFPKIWVYYLNSAVVVLSALDTHTDLAPDQLSAGYPSIPVSFGATFLYGYMLAYTLVSLAREVPQWSLMWAHHSVTLALLLYSYQLNYLRIGHWVLLTHTITEPVVEWTKASPTVPRGLVLLAVWFVARLHLFPRVVLSTTLDLTYWTYPGFAIMNTMLLGLMALNVTWFVGISHKVYLALQK